MENIIVDKLLQENKKTYCWRWRFRVRIFVVFIFISRMFALNKHSNCEIIITVRLEFLLKLYLHNETKINWLYQYIHTYKDLIRVLQDLLEFVFNGGRKTQDGNSKYLTVRVGSCFFLERSMEITDSFTKNKIKMLLHYLISDIFFTVCNIVFRQCIGIPIGIDPSLFWANLYPHHYDNRFMIKLIKTDR